MEELEGHQSRFISGLKVETYVDQNDNDCEYSYEYGDIQIGAPVLDDDSGCREVVREDHRILEEIVPSRGKPGDISTEMTYVRTWYIYPRAGSTNRVAYPPKPLSIGSIVDISPIAVMTKKTTMPTTQ